MQSLSICIYFKLRFSHAKLHGDISQPHPAACHSHYITCKTSPGTVRLNQMKVFFLLLFLPLFCSVNHSWNPKTLLMHRWNGCICGKDTAGFFLHGDRWEEITDKKYSAQFLNPDALSLMFLWGCHFTHISWFITACLHCVHKLYQKDLISKAFIRGRVSGWDGGLWNFRCALGRDCDLFCEMKADLWPLHLRWKRKHPFSEMEVDRRY